MSISSWSARIALSILAVFGVAAASAIADPPPGYYDTVDASDPTSLRVTLHDVIDDHVRYPYTSSATDTWDILELADEDPGNASRILDVYRNASYAKEGGGNSFYNREHTWPKSYGFPNDGSTNYPYTDCHHLMLCDSSYNSSRSNKPYRYCSSQCSEKTTDVNNGQGGGTGVYPGNSNWTDGANESGTWEVWIDRRGDIARALFYMDLRYEGGTHGTTGVTEPDLILTDQTSLIVADTSSNQSVAYMGYLSELYQWHVEDPVDALEQARNDVVFGFQGNRNPFVDHPEWADCLYGGGACGTTGSAMVWINEFHYDNASSDTGEFVEIAGPAGTDLTGYSLVGYNGNGGAPYDTVTLSGTISDQGGCTGTLSFTFTGLQNGSPDGIALVDAGGSVVEFVSYEGTLVATSGPAAGMTSVDVGVSETTSTPVGHSIQRVGTGAGPADFVWQAPTTDSPGSPNIGQTFTACDGLAPAQPTGLAATGGNGFIDLDWNDNTEPDLDGYNVYRSTAPGGPYGPLNGSLVGGSAYTDTSVTNGTTYYYVVTAVDESGNESDDSNEASATPDAPPGGGGTPWINEIHYDNDGSDTGEFVEIAGTAGTDLAGWSLVGYNGNGGGTYATVSLSGVLPDEGGCRGTLDFAFAGLQNGSPDGIALVDDTGQVVEFLSYEGSLTATNGPAAGMTSIDIGVSEPTSSPVGYSLQLVGTGSEAADFVWQAPAADSPGSRNVGQTFDACSGGGGPIVLADDDFESGWGNYTDGGNDCRLYSGSHAPSGSSAAAIQDNSGTASSFTLTNGIDVDTPGYTSVEVTFTFKAVSMESGEDFFVRYWDGTSWTTVATFARGVDFNNGEVLTVSVTIDESQFVFPTDMRIRFQCDASSNADDVYIDDITITAE